MWVDQFVAFESRPSSDVNRLIPLENSPFQHIALAAAASSFLGDRDGDGNPPAGVGAAGGVVPRTNSCGDVFFLEWISALSLSLLLLWSMQSGRPANAVIPREGGVASALPPPSLLDGPKIGAWPTATTPKKSSGTGTSANVVKWGTAAKAGGGWGRGVEGRGADPVRPPEDHTKVVLAAAAAAQEGRGDDNRDNKPRGGKRGAPNCRTNRGMASSPSAPPPLPPTAAQALMAAAASAPVASGPGTTSGFGGGGGSSRGTTETTTSATSEVTTPPPPPCIGVLEIGGIASAPAGIAPAPLSAGALTIGAAKPTEMTPVVKSGAISMANIMKGTASASSAGNATAAASSARRGGWTGKPTP